MTVGLKLGRITDEIGGQDFFYAFFSTISFRLERNGWGSRFPCLLNNLYQGKLEREDADQALKELDVITSELKNFSPDKVVWDIDNLEKRPPWGSNISSDIENLSHYFVTSSGRDLISVLRECIEQQQSKGGTIEVVSI